MGHFISVSIPTYLNFVFVFVVTGVFCNVLGFHETLRPCVICVLAGAETTSTGTGRKLCGSEPNRYIRSTRDEDLFKTTTFKFGILRFKVLYP